METEYLSCCFFSASKERSVQIHLSNDWIDVHCENFFLFFSFQISTDIITFLNPQRIQDFLNLNLHFCFKKLYVMERNAIIYTFPKNVQN